ncbi:MAG: TAT-variant-translocated molybdopterin oxidoreductase [Phycisphaerales bacterium]
MSAHDQCPSSVKKGKPGKAALAAEARRLSRVSGGASAAPAWRSLEEVADTPEFRDLVEREFPAGASELLEPATRRTFLQIMGASIALAGAATIPGCRRPDHKIMPYAAQVPEQVIPGKRLYYATSMSLPGGGAEGLLVETHEGRPTKVEGNPLHPTNRGKSGVWAQASVLSLYDPDRLKYPSFLLKGETARRPATWDDFKAWSKEHFEHYDRAQGQGLALLVDKKSSPSRDAMRDRLLKRFPRAMWVPYDAADSETPAAGSAIAFGAPVREQLSLVEAGRIKAKVIVSLDRDFLDQADPANLIHQREWAATRRVLTTQDEMSRLYVVESGMSNTGACADHRLRLAPSRIEAFAVMLARAVAHKTQGASWGPLQNLLAGMQAPAGADIPPQWAEAVAEDLVLAKHYQDGKPAGTGTYRAGETLLVAGPTLSPAIHALVHAMNAALGNIGKTVSYLPMSPELAAPSARGLAQLAQAMDSGAVTTLVCLNTNPVYDAPADLGFAQKLAKVTSICLSTPATETAAASGWSLNGACELEAWGDTMSWDGAIAPIQPMIAPIYDPARSDLELLAIIADPNAAILGGDAAATAPAGSPAAVAQPAAAQGATQAPRTTPRVDDGYTIVRQAWRAMMGGGTGEAGFEKAWKRALHDGLSPIPPQQPEARQVNLDAVADAISRLQFGAPPSAAALEAVFAPGMVYDGRFANNGWLQELPQPGTRVVWDNPALVSPATARALGVLPDNWSDTRTSQMYTRKFPSGQRATITVGGRTLEMAVWILPGMADHTVILPLGYGRQIAGRVGDGVGFNTYLLRDSQTGLTARGVTAARADGEYPVSSTQAHWTLEGRTTISRAVDLLAWQKHGDPAKNPTEPPADPLYGHKADLPINFAEKVGGGELSHTPPNVSIYPHPFTGTRTGIPAGAAMPFSKGPQWGMSIDLSTCTGCGACTIACQAENNIPIVGKKEVAKNREMHWIRVDRYFTGDDLNEPAAILHQPVPCMQCENAPCETVCPVNATVHGPEGLNYQAYNRCIGTRYCENNCPYKVRRFNFFDYGVKKFNGDYVGKEALESVLPDRGGITGSGRHNKLNPNLIPPRLREKLSEIEKMQKNPDVTVRSRGVMEKCTYCIQRLNEARIEMKLHDLNVMPDGFVQTACQQACPTDAIVFGDRLDAASNGGTGSRVRQMQESQRTYQLLGYLNTRPRTTYMVRVANPNPALRRPEEDPFGHHGVHGHEGGGHDDQGHSAIDRSTFIREQARGALDKGYALSLRVLGAIS